MNIHEAIDYARAYLYHKVVAQGPIEEYRLNRALQYRFCDGFERLERNFGEVTRKDAAMLIEAWIMAQGTMQPNRPLLHESQFDDGSDKLVG